MLACFLPLSLQHVQADEDEVEYSLPSYVGHLSIHDDGNATFSQEVTYDFDSDYKGQYVALGKIGGYSIMDDPKVSATVNGKEKQILQLKKQTLMMVLNSKFIIQVQMVIGSFSKLLGKSNSC